MSAPPIPAVFDGEVWKKIPSIPEYEASTLGRVRRQAPALGGMGSIRIPTGVLKLRALPSGHLLVTLSVGNVPRTVLVHRLIAETFLPPPADGKDCVCHRDDEPSNNVPDNLFWGTRADNTNDMVSKGRQARGERVTSAKLTEQDVIQIRARVLGSESQYDLAEAFGVSQSNISMIASRVTWKHVA